VSALVLHTAAVVWLALCFGRAVGALSAAGAGLAGWIVDVSHEHAVLGVEVVSLNATLRSLALVGVALVAATLGAALVELDRLAGRDQLTGLANRRAVADRLGADVARARADGVPLAVLRFDLDGLEAVNDTLGHPAGDALIMTFADRLTAVIDDGGIVGRMGGDEFVAIVVGADRQRVADLVRTALDGPVACTAGAVVWRDEPGRRDAAVDEDDDHDWALSEADVLLCRAKRARVGALVEERTWPRSHRHRARSAGSYPTAA
ncbi:MAG: GGDEF domain-containing protein, partial [Actinomycetota bacterium]|nr:GGDEF domain-containing protein [Actinomycetota bacterium]